MKQVILRLNIISTLFTPQLFATSIDFSEPYKPEPYQWSFFPVIEFSYLKHQGHVLRSGFQYAKHMSVDKATERIGIIGGVRHNIESNTYGIFVGYGYDLVFFGSWPAASIFVERSFDEMQTTNIAANFRMAIFTLEVGFVKAHSTTARPYFGIGVGLF